MNSVDVAQKLIRRYKTTDPFILCSAVGIEIINADLGNLKGMYTCIKRNRFVVINQSLDLNTRKIICAHELAHDQLHRKISSSSWLKDYNIYISNSKQEYEANIFVAELLVNEEMLFELIKEKKTIFDVARIMRLDYNLIAIKVKTLIDKGYKLNYQDFDSSFLKTIIY